MDKKAIILGASGLIGSELLQLLIESEHYKEIVVFVRKPLAVQSDKLVQSITDFKNLEKLKTLISADIVFSCLGSTKAKTPDKKDYIYIDKTIPETITTYASENKVQQFHIVSALGANANSSIFYNKIKGETEDFIKHLPIPGIYIYQPSLIKGNRKEKRFGEDLAVILSKFIDPLLIGRLKKYRSIESITIAKAMYNQSLKNEKGIFTISSDKIKELA